MMHSILILPTLTTLLCIAKSQSQDSPQAAPRSDLVEDGGRGLLGPGSLRFSTSVEDSESRRPRFVLFRSSNDVNDEDEGGETTSTSSTGTATVDKELAVEKNEDVSKSKPSFRLFRFVTNDDSQELPSESFQPASTITGTESIQDQRNLETATVTLDVEEDDKSINIFGSNDFPETAETMEEQGESIVSGLKERTELE